MQIVKLTFKSVSKMVPQGSKVMTLPEIRENGSKLKESIDTFEGVQSVLLRESKIP